MAISGDNKRIIRLNGKWSNYVVPKYKMASSVSYSVGEHMLWRDVEYKCITAYTSSPGAPDLTKWEVTDFTSLDLTMAGNSPIPTVTSKESETDISTADGTIYTSRQSGRLRFNKLVTTYTFTHAIERYDKNGVRLSLNEMNRLVNQHNAAVKEWIYDPEPYDYNPSGIIQARLVNAEDYAFYDTGIGVPSSFNPDIYSGVGTGYWLMNARCTNYSFTKTTSSDIWLLQYQLEITTDPWMYEIGANPITYTMFSGPTTDGVGMDKVSVKIYSERRDNPGIHPWSPDDYPIPSNVAMLRHLWTNDNITWILSDSVTKDTSVEPHVYHATFTFKPQVAPIYKGGIGVYTNFYVAYTFNDVTYNYKITGLESVSHGTYDTIYSEKIHTPEEMGYTNQDGFTATFELLNNDLVVDHIDELINATNGHLPMQFIWGAAKTFGTITAQTPLMITANGPVDRFKRVNAVGHSPDTIMIGASFTLDNDPYNELIMNTTNYGFYTLESPDNARRQL